MKPAPLPSLMPLLPLLWLAGCQPQDQAPLPGYAEADFVQVAAPSGGRLLKLPVKEGDEVQPDQLLFALEAEPQQAALAASQALLAQRQAQLTDLTKGLRTEEIAALQAQLESAQAELRQARRDHERQTSLRRQGFSSQANLDDSRTRQETAEAQVRNLQAQLAVGQLAGRPDALQAATAATQAAAAQVQQDSWQLAQRQQQAHSRAQVDEILFRVGEWVPAGEPVLNLLPDDGVKIRFFVPQDRLSRLKPGQTIQVGCDACSGKLAARISHIANEAEFTPPVIYSQANRAKLVFLVEAKPLQTGTLRPGQPLDVYLEPAG